MKHTTKTLVRLGTRPIWPVRRVRAARRMRTLLHALLATLVVLLLLSTREIESQVQTPLPLAPTLPYSDALLSLAMPGDVPLNVAAADVPRPFTLRRGQTLTGLLDELGLARSEALAAVEAAKDFVNVRRIRAGENGAAFFDDAGLLTRLRLGISGKGQLELARASSGWTSDWHEAVRAVSVRQVDGCLDDSLIAAIRSSGGDAAVAYKMSDVLQWDLDFNRDLRVGDCFSVLYEDIALDGEPMGVGSILALTYQNRGHTYEAFRFGEEGAYYDSEGKPRRKMFLRSPLPFSRITSRFSHRRFHPVLKVHRPHYGVDYGAPTGTPVRVTATGTVTFAGWTKGGGKTVKVRHSNGYLTAYLHLSRYAAGIRSGRRVRQEEVVGYVGATGLATGPHLDYRVQKNGRWIDPLRIPNTPADPVPEAEMASFREYRNTLLAWMSKASNERDSSRGDALMGLFEAP